ncbi:MAG: hypothetical protein RIS64_3887 [Bacteroidota bacterium]
MSYWVLQMLACSKPFKNDSIQNMPVKPEMNYYEPHLTPITDSQQTHLIRACVLSGQYYREGRGHMNPCFNPNNPYEIAFMQADSNKCVGLFKFSFVTGKKTYLIQLPCGSIDWSSKGWILFVTHEGNLSKIKDNGDSLTTLAQTGYLEPKWSPSGNAFMYTIGDEISICNANGTLIKTIYDRIATVDWLSDSTLIYSNYQNNIKYHLFTNRRENVPTYKFAMNLWEKGEHFAYYWVSKGIGKTDYYMRYNYNSGITDTLKILYDSYFYMNLKYHPKTKKCLVELDRRKWKDAHKCDILYKRNLILMNPDGTDEKLIRIPD